MNQFKLFTIHLECRKLLESLPVSDEFDDDASDYRDDLINLMEEGESYYKDLKHTSSRLKEALKAREEKVNFLKYNNRKPNSQSDFI